MGEPSFEMELAGLCRVTGDRQVAHSTQYPAVDFSILESLPNRVAASSKFRRVSVGGASKRIRLGTDESGGACTEDTRTSALKQGGFPVLDAFSFFRREEIEQDPPEMSEDDEQGEDEDLMPDDEVVTDPVEALGSELFLQVLSYLGPETLAACLLVSATWRKCAQADVLWDEVCKETWRGKINISRHLLDTAMPRFQALQISIADARRVGIETEDLSGWIWELRYKELTGDYWRQLDPYYHGLPSMRRVFHEDGHITAEPMDQIWGGHECSWTLRKSKSRGGVTQVRINHWPLLQVTRTPNWGWKMENAWVVYTSTNIPTDRRKDTAATPE